MLAAFVLSGALLCACASNADAAVPPGLDAPTIATSSALHGALLVTLSSTVPNAPIHYTLDGSTPTTASQQYQSPFLVAANLTVKAVITAPTGDASPVAARTFTPNIPPGTLVWSDEFPNPTNSAAQPDPHVWTYETGQGGFGNREIEDYCAWGSDVAPCSTAAPNAFVGAHGSLHIVARQPVPGRYTSARLITAGLFSFQYGRIEARMMLPEGQGLWPAFWLLGNNIATVNWPACGELDIMEHIDGSNPGNEGFDWVQGSIHGTGLNGGIQYHPSGFSATGWHTYGMIWIRGQIQYYVDNPSNVYATFTAATQQGTWPFDQGPEYILLNLAVGGDWPGSPNSTTVFPSTMLVDYVRIYAN